MTDKKYGGEDFGKTLEQLKKIAPFATTLDGVSFEGNARKVGAILELAGVAGELIAEIERLNGLTGKPSIELNLYQLKALVEMADAADEPEDDPIIICVGGDKCHSGPGLYAYWRECPEEGSEFIGENEEDQQRGNKLAEAFEAAQEIEP